MKDIVIDYETYYKKDEVSVTNLGNANYTAAADACILSIVSDDIQWVGTVPEARVKFGDGFFTTPEHRFIAANSGFDESFSRKYGWTPARPYKCVLDRAKFHQLPQDLASIIKTVFGGKVDKSIRDSMSGVEYSELSPERQKALRDYCLNDSIETYKLWKHLPEMSPVEERIADYTRMTNRRGVKVDVDLVEADKTKLNQIRFDAFKAIPWHNIAKPLSYPALCAWAGAEGIPVPASLAKTSDECRELMDLHPRLAEVIRTLRTYRRTNTIVTKANSLLERVTPEGILPLDLLYCGARHTRRWSSQGFNVQNLDREPFKFGENSVWSRKWIVPRAGKTFLILDYSQIEPRCLAWLVGNESLLSAVHQGFGIYEAYARQFKGWTGAPGTLKKDWGTTRYTLLKNEIIGLSYGLGSKQFVKYNHTYGGLVISQAESKKMVDTYRRQNPKIPALWRKFDDLVKRACLDKDKTIEIQLPTGDLLKHFYISSKTKVVDGRQFTAHQSFTIKGDFGRGSIQESLWGGVLTENVTQRMARDTLAEAILRLEDAGLPVLWSSHDEVIIEIDDDASKEEAKKTAEEIMRKPPEWAPDLPLAVEGGFAAHYDK